MRDALLLRDVELDGRRTDVLIHGDAVAAIGAHRAVPRGAEVIDAAGGALLPGLWDHHLHLVALAAARRSVWVGPPQVRDAAGFTAALRAARSATTAGWIRAVGYHESVAGSIDRHDIDRAVADLPVRIQHRSGALWIINSEAIGQLGLEDDTVPGLERDDAGAPTGRVLGADRWLRERMERRGHADPPPDLSAVGRELAGYGVTGVTDATPYQRLRDLDLLAASVAGGDIPQHVVAMGGPPLSGARFPADVGRGPVKLLLAEHALPSLDDLTGWIADAHASARPVAIHCVTRESLVLAITALDQVGTVVGDRIEHGSLVPPEQRTVLAAKELTVVTQPNFVAERGDEYLVDVDPDDHPYLYPCRTLLDAGVAVAGSTDAPFGHPDPWRAMVAATERRTAAGVALGADEAVTPRRALELFLGRPDDSGGPPRTVMTGHAADLCLLDAPQAEALADPSSAHVRVTIIGGTLVHAR